MLKRMDVFELWFYKIKEYLETCGFYQREL